MFPLYYLDCYLESPLCDMIAFSGARKNKGEARRRKASLFFIISLHRCFCAAPFGRGFLIQCRVVTFPRLVSPQTFIALGLVIFLQALERLLSGRQKLVFFQVLFFQIPCGNTFACDLNKVKDEIEGLSPD